MAKAYMFRHQVAGIVTSHVFLKPPTEAQIAPIKAECERLHGKAGWGMVHEAELMDDDVPSFPERAPAGGAGDNRGTGAGARVEVSGVGTVTPLEGSRIVETITASDVAALDVKKLGLEISRAGKTE